MNFLKIKILRLPSVLRRVKGSVAVQESMLPNSHFPLSMFSSEISCITQPTILVWLLGLMKLGAASKLQTLQSLRRPGAAWNPIDLKKWITRKCPGQWGIIMAVRDRGGRDTLPWWKKKGFTTGNILLISTFLLPILTRYLLFISLNHISINLAIWMSVIELS